MTFARRSLIEAYEELAGAERELGLDPHYRELQEQLFARANYHDAKARWWRLPWWKRLFTRRPTQ